jgi:hypothetical protein
MKGSKGKFGLPPATISQSRSHTTRSTWAVPLRALWLRSPRTAEESLSATGARNMLARAAATICAYKAALELEGASVRTRCESIWCSCSFLSSCDMNSAKRYAFCYTFLFLPAPTGPFPSGLVRFRHEAAEPSSIVIPMQTIGHVASTHQNVLAGHRRHTT